MNEKELNEIRDPVKKGTWIFEKYERKFLGFVLPRVPKFIEPYHLVWMTFVWSILILIISFLARRNIEWLWVFSIIILLQMVTDMMDGSLGRYRKTGLVIWGTFMDHFLDMAFLSSVVIGYYIIAGVGLELQFLILLAILNCLMFASILYFAATRELHISVGGLGIAEIRLLPVIFNLVILFVGKWTVSFIINFLIAISAMILISTILKIDRKTWFMDMRNKGKRGG